MANKNRKLKLNRLLLDLTLVAAAITVATIAALELTGKTHIFRKPQAVSGVIPSTPTPMTGAPISEEKSNNRGGVDGRQPESPKQGDDTTAPPPEGTPPNKPSGNFVSQHHPNLDGDPAPSAIESVCNTTPGAKCYIEFTNNDGITKTLAAQVTDGSGAAYWSWDVKNAGFTVGTWKIKVVAELNGLTATADDPQSLEVGP